MNTRKRLINRANSRRLRQKIDDVTTHVVEYPLDEHKVTETTLQKCIICSDVVHTNLMTPHILKHEHENKVRAISGQTTSSGSGKVDVSIQIDIQTPIFFY